MSKSSILYNYIQKHIKEMFKSFSLDELYDFGKSLCFDERLLYEYRIECFKNKTRYIEHLAPTLFENDFINRLITNDELEYIVKEIDSIIKGEYSLRSNLLKYLKDKLNKIDVEDQNKIYYLIVKSLSNNKDKEEINKVYRLFINVTKEENSTLLDLEKLKDGGFSKIYKINNKIIKIGTSRACPEISDNNRLFLPEFKGFVGNDFIEITDYLENKNDIREEDIYNVYKELRNQGVIWKDPTASNLARLDKENLIKQIERMKRKKELGIRENPNYIDRVLNPNDLVIIDLDHMIFDYELDKQKEMDKALNNYLIKVNKEFDKRYKKELSAKTKKKVL